MHLNSFFRKQHSDNEIDSTSTECLGFQFPFDLSNKKSSSFSNLGCLFLATSTNANNHVENMTSGMLDIVYNVSYGIKLKILKLRLLGSFFNRC